MAGNLSPSASARGERYRRIAEENAEFLLHHLQADSGRLFHTWKRRPGAGSAAGLNDHRTDDQATRILLGAATSGFFAPHQVVAYGPAGVAAPAAPLLEDRDSLRSRMYTLSDQAKSSHRSSSLICCPPQPQN